MNDENYGRISGIHQKVLKKFCYLKGNLMPRNSLFFNFKTLKLYPTGNEIEGCPNRKFSDFSLYQFTFNVHFKPFLDFII